ncbi:hypothetical protein P154DRAFT_263687 [Amniculicola lignicola CBS 123094]|uniref:Uncharacterized protein n=1 Tax=Amniculicola lignicola CBS 123094 TaxID=1392246 RepID=A0A6A5WBL6_9PLEO|nr:hypothetical protein P154DRAFT_263687 [Amniculicola lignicola CBS 123094]
MLQMTTMICRQCSSPPVSQASKNATLRANDQPCWSQSPANVRNAAVKGTLPPRTLYRSTGPGQYGAPEISFIGNVHISYSAECGDISTAVPSSFTSRFTHANSTKSYRTPKYIRPSAPSARSKRPKKKVVQAPMGKRPQGSHLTGHVLGCSNNKVLARATAQCLVRIVKRSPLNQRRRLTDGRLQHCVATTLQRYSISASCLPVTAHSHLFFRFNSAHASVNPRLSSKFAVPPIRPSARISKYPP